MKILLSLFIWFFLLLIPSRVLADFNVASVYELADPDLKNGDIIISNGATGLTGSNVIYDTRIFGVLVDNPLMVFREATGSARPVLRAGDVTVNVTDFNGQIKKGDYVTTSTLSGKGMKANHSGYVLGIALKDAVYNGGSATTENKSVKVGSVDVALRIEYAELNTARNANRFLEQLNAAFFANVKDPERFVVVIRYFIGGLIALLAFAIGFFAVTRSMSNAVEAIGRNPLARSTILLSVGIQIFIALAGAIATIIIILIIIRI